MHLRKLVLACGFASFALSNYASALGLGEVKLNSTLNQPLSAEVQLLDTRDLTAQQIIIALASPADFERNGVDRLYFYTEFHFEVVLDHPGGPIVRVTTRNAVREPYLNFLIEARWSAGRLLREYTILMDLPTFAEEVPRPVQAAEISKSKIASTTSTVTSKPPVARTPVRDPVSEELVEANEEKPAIIAEQDQPAKKSKVGAGTYGPIGNKDTLWEIAKAVRPDSSVSVHQTMLALQRLNPEAFIRGNINLLKKGQVLRVPDANEASGISKSEALSQVNAQNTDWSGASASTTGLGAQLDASRRTPSARQQSETVSGSVKLEAPSATPNAGNGQGSGANKGAGKALEAELSATLEELDRAKSEKTELSSRVHDLEDQVKTMQKLVDVSNEKLRALQLNTNKSAEQKSLQSVAATAKPASSAVTASSLNSVAASSLNTVVSSSLAAEVLVAAQVASVDSSSVALSSAAASSVAVKKKDIVKPAALPPEKSIVDHISDNFLWVILGLVVLGGVAGALIMRRRKAETEESDIEFNESDNTFSSEANFDAFNQVDEDVSLPDEPIDEIALIDEEEVSAVAETGDVVGEADIYIAYGKFDQAEEMLLNGLAKDPDSSEIRLKLLEVYSQTQNAREFDKHYAFILPLASAFALNRAAELRANIADVGSFDGEYQSPQVAAASPVIEDDFSFDLDLDDDSAIKNTPSSSSSNSYQFDESPIIEQKITHEDDDFTLDFEQDESAIDASQAEDLSEITLALDGLNDEILEDDLEVVDTDDEFSFDFKDLDAPTTTASRDAVSAPTPVSVLDTDDLQGDDFNLEMDVDNIDMAALDHEMDDFDADISMLDFGETKNDAMNIKSNFDEDDSLDEDFAWSEEDEISTLEEDSKTIASDLDDIDESFDAEQDSSLAELDDELLNLHETPVLHDTPVKESDAFVQALDDETLDDDLFEQALSDFSAEGLNLAAATELSNDDMDAELDFMADTDEAATKLDLARAYIDMGDNDGARDILAEVAHEGNEQQRHEAVDLLSRIDV